MFSYVELVIIQVCQILKINHATDVPFFILLLLKYLCIKINYVFQSYNTYSRNVLFML